MKFKLSFACLIGMLAFVLAACGAPATPAPAPTLPAGAPTQPPAAVQPTAAVTQPTATAPTGTGGQPLAKARISINSKLTTPDPHKPDGLAGFIGLYLMGGQLFRLNPDFTASPWLAEKMDLSSDGGISSFSRQ